MTTPEDETQEASGRQTGSLPDVYAPGEDAAGAQGTRLILDSLESAEDAEGADEEAAAGSPKRRRRWVIAVSILVGLLVLALVAIGVIVARGYNSVTQIPRETDLVINDPEYPTPTVPMVERALNFAVMGSDSRGPDQGRSDVLMIAHLTADRQKLFLISFPRDMYVSIPGHGKNKINAAYAFGGPALAAKTLQKLTDVPIDHTVLINFEDFTQVTNLVGAITFDNKHESKAGGYSFPKGQISLAGEELLAYVRQRRGLPNGDLDRTERHRTVLKALFLKLASKETLANPQAIIQILDTIGDYISVDANLTNDILLGIGASLKISSSADIVLMQAPVSGYGRTKAGASIDIVNEPLLKELSAALQEDDLDFYIEKNGNGSGLTRE
ncbi:MAG: LCP family protein [Propionibacteriaceae bacterium]|jgi:LCP family protein required for cell wall assembly|nr:LCP family protein [Propionibacteriaceae bacterium]